MDKTLLEYEAKQLLRDFQIPVLAFEFCQTEEEAVRAALPVGFSVGLKIVSQQIAHKSEAGGAKHNINNVERNQQGYAGKNSSVRN